MEMPVFYTVMDYIMCASEALPLPVYAMLVIWGRRPSESRWWLLGAVLLLGGIYEFTADRLWPEVSLFWYYGYTMLEMIMIVYFFKSYLPDKRVSRVGLVLFGLFILALFTTESEAENLHRFGWVCLVEFVFSLYCTVHWARRAFENLTYPSLFGHPEFYVVIGIAFYLVTCTFYYLIYPYMMLYPKDNDLFYWIILPLCIIIYGGSVIIGMFRLPKSGPR